MPGGRGDVKRRRGRTLRVEFPEKSETHAARDLFIRRFSTVFPHAANSFNCCSAASFENTRNRIFSFVREYIAGYTHSMLSNLFYNSFER